MEILKLPYFYISKSNSLRFASRVAFGDSFNYKTDENTLSSEVDCNIAYAEIQQFQSADIITTQFKSNYASNIATIVKSDKSEVNIPVVKKSSNMGITDSRFNYEVYEFEIDMVDYIDQYFQVRINNTDPNFSEVIHLSEQIWCKVKHEKVLEIKYSNSTNTDMFYATGIENLIRIPYYLIKGKSDEESEVHKTDTTSILLNADIYEVDDFVFEPVTKELWRKLMQALSHEKVTINGVSYVKNGNFNTDGPLEESNLYVLTATMIKTANVYISQTSGGLDFNGTEVEVPALITTETGFVSY